jgi:class 3 adenylate cyclase
VTSTVHVTVLFTDLVGSTELASALTLKAGGELRQRHFSMLRQASRPLGNHQRGFSVWMKCPPSVL